MQKRELSLLVVASDATRTASGRLCRRAALGLKWALGLNCVIPLPRIRVTWKGAESYLARIGQALVDLIER